MLDDHGYTLRVGEKITKVRNSRSESHHTHLKNEHKLKLIECVRKFPCLYDIASIEYKDSHNRNISWEKVARDVGFPASACKSAWDILRNNYNRVRRGLQNCPAGSAKKKIWAFYSPLAFLGGDEHVEVTSNVTIEGNAEQLEEVAIDCQDPETTFISDYGESSSNQISFRNRISVSNAYRVIGIAHDAPAAVSQNEYDPLADHQIPRKKIKPSMNGSMIADRSVSIVENSRKAPDNSFRISACGTSGMHKVTESPCEPKSETTLFGQLVSAKLETMDFNTREIAMHKINEILFKARMGLLENT